MQTFGEAKMAKSPKDKDLIVHAALKNDSLSIMASDVQPGNKVVFGDNFHMSLAGQDNTKLTEIFGKLGRGGKVDMPLAKQFWGDTFGMLTDKFGVHWMINVVAKPQ